MDACFTRPLSQQRFEHRTGTIFRVLGESLPFPNVVLVAHRRVPAGDRRRLRDLVLHPEASAAGRTLVDLGFGLYDLFRSGDYDIARDVVRFGETSER